MTTLSDIASMTNTVALENLIQTWELRVRYLVKHEHAESDIRKAKAMADAAKKRLGELNG